MAHPQHPSFSGPTQELFGEPTLSENVSAGVVGEIWEKVRTRQWRAFSSEDHDLAVMVEQFVRKEALSYDTLKRHLPGGPPLQTYAWRSQHGVIHDGALWLNGTVYRQAAPDGRSVLLLFVDEEVATRLEAACRHS